MKQGLISVVTILSVMLIGVAASAPLVAAVRALEPEGRFDGSSERPFLEQDAFAGTRSVTIEPTGLPLEIRGHRWNPTESVLYFELENVTEMVITAWAWEAVDRRPTGGETRVRVAEDHAEPMHDLPAGISALRREPQHLDPGESTRTYSLFVRPEATKVVLRVAAAVGSDGKGFGDDEVLQLIFQPRWTAAKEHAAWLTEVERWLQQEDFEVPALSAALEGDLYWDLTWDSASQIGQIRREILKDVRRLESKTDVRSLRDRMEGSRDFYLSQLPGDYLPPSPAVIYQAEFGGEEPPPGGGETCECGGGARRSPFVAPRGREL